jgi:hypothetical protein
MPLQSPTPTLDLGRFYTGIIFFSFSFPGMSPVSKAKMINKKVLHKHELGQFASCCCSLLDVSYIFKFIILPFEFF